MAEAATGGKAITMTKCHKPNVLLVDVQMPDMNGLDALQQIRGEHAGDQGDHDLAV